MRAFFSRLATTVVGALAARWLLLGDVTRERRWAWAMSTVVALPIVFRARPLQPSPGSEG